MHKAQSLSPAQPMLPRDVPNGPWQEITANYLTPRGREYLLVCNLFGKYTSFIKYSLNLPSPCACTCRNSSPDMDHPALLYTDNGPPFAFDEFAQLLQHHHIDHITLWPHFPWSNGFIECQVCAIKTVLSTSQDSRKSIKDLLLELCSTPIVPNMPPMGDPT